MRALVWDGRAARVAERPTPPAGGDRALVRVALAGVCNTYLEIVRGYLGFRGVLGHELVGTVEEVPEPSAPLEPTSWWRPPAPRRASPSRWPRCARAGRSC